MRKRQETRRVRRSIITAIIVAALATTGVNVPAAPARAAAPAVANTWTLLMYRSLTATATGIQLRQTFAVQRTAVIARTAEVTAATAALAVAQRHVRSVTAADATAKARVTAARQAVTTAKKDLTKANPRYKSAVTRARNAVTAAERALVSRTSEAKDMATLLTTTSASAATAGTALVAANNAAKSATDALALTQLRIAASKTPAQWAAQAATVSSAVVTAVRPGFTVADTVLVYGTTVNRTIAYPYQHMVDDAKKAGVAISGGGFRTRQRQIELRTINGCPDVWTAPSSSCRVPTAIPGRSLHEIGLAIDITSGGRTISSKSPAFKWLQAHAAEYGFKNLPSEAWHWSITGS